MAGRFGLQRISEALLLGQRGKWFWPNINTENRQQTVVATVAHGDLYHVAQAFSRKHKLPLVTFFHDWWPDIANVNRRSRSQLDSQFQQLYRDSDLALCVSSTMRSKLDELITEQNGKAYRHPNAHVLLPIASSNLTAPQQPDKPAGKYFKLVYAGNLADYGPMIARLMRAVTKHPTLKIEVRGNAPKWPIEFQEEMRQRGMWLPFAQGAKFENWIHTADAILIPQTFDIGSRRKMETNFPSKISEFAKYGKPLIFWGPEYGSSAVFNQSNTIGLPITNGSPTPVVNELIRLQDDHRKQKQLSRAAITASQNLFCPLRSQQQFVSLLKRVAGMPEPTMQINQEKEGTQSESNRSRYSNL